MPLNKYLFKIKKATSNKCKNCFETSGIAIPETVQHFLFECPAYVQEQHEMAKAIERRSKDLKHILEEKERTKELLKFIEKSGHLTWN